METKTKKYRRKNFVEGLDDRRNPATRKFLAEVEEQAENEMQSMWRCRTLGTCKATKEVDEEATQRGKMSIFPRKQREAHLEQRCSLLEKSEETENGA